MAIALAAATMQVRLLKLAPKLLPLCKQCGTAGTQLAHHAKHSCTAERKVQHASQSWRPVAIIDHRAINTFPG
jgi:hypothetical protein